MSLCFAKIQNETVKKAIIEYLPAISAGTVPT